MKVCYICGKTKAAGRTIQHQHAGGWQYRAPKKPRAFKLNIRKVDLEYQGRVIRADVCMKCYKRLRKEN